MEQVKQNLIIQFRNGQLEEFNQMLSYQLGSGFLGVLDKEGVMHIYPSDQINKVVITPQEKEQITYGA